MREKKKQVVSTTVHEVKLNKLPDSEWNHLCLNKNNRLKFKDKEKRMMAVKSEADKLDVLCIIFTHQMRLQISWCT